MDPILARVGATFVYSYTLWLGLGLAGALWLTARLGQGRLPLGWVDGAFAAALGALLGGRAGYVWLHRDYFAGHPAEVWQLWLGGLAYHGALLGGLLGFALWARLSRRARGVGTARFADLFAPGLALLILAGWVACGVEGCAYGREPAAIGPLFPLVAGDLPDDYGVYGLRYRTQLLGVVGSALVLGLSVWASLRGRLAHSPGALFWLTLAGLSLVRVGVALVRGDPVLLVGGYRLDLLLDGAIALMSLVVAGLAVGRANRARLA